MAAKKPRVTAWDVARAAGVSQSTVSYVMNDSPNQKISAATRERVLKAMKDLGYAPSAIARSLRTGTSNLILVVLPDLSAGVKIAQILEALSSELEPLGYSVIYRRHRGSALLERAWQATMPAAVANLGVLSEQEEAKIVAAGIPVVDISSNDPRPGSVSMDQLALGKLQVAHLLERGHSKIGYAAPAQPRAPRTLEQRLAGVREVLATARKPEPNVIRFPLDAAACAAAITPWLAKRGKNRVTAVCAYNDDWAFALLAGMRILGASAPEDLAVIGVDNVPLAPFSSPPLTTIDINAEDTARIAAGTLVAIINGDTPALMPERPVSLVRRETT